MTGFSTSGRSPNATTRVRRAQSQLAREGRPNSNFDVTTGVNAVGTGNELDGIRFTTVDGNVVFIVGVSAELAMYRDAESGSLIVYVDGTGARWTVNTLIETDLENEDVAAETCLELGDALTFRATSAPSTPSSTKAALYMRAVQYGEPEDETYNDNLRVVFDDGTTRTLANQLQPSIASGLAVSRITSADSPYFATDLDDVIEIDATSGAVTVYVPTRASRTAKRMLRFKRVDSSANAVTLNGTGETIDGQSSRSLSHKYHACAIVPGTTEWIIVAGYQEDAEPVSLSIGGTEFSIGGATIAVEQAA